MRKILIWCLVMGTLILAGHQFYSNKKVAISQNISNRDTFAFKTSDPINITIIGDSVAKGIGDEKGSGFSTYLPEYLKDKTNGDISVYNAGVNGLKSSGLVELLKDEKIGKRIGTSDIVVISIGGNDLLNVYSVSDDKKLSALKSVQDKYLDNLKTVLTTIREKNPYAPIAFIGLYNPRQDTASPLINMLLNKWNRESYNLIEKDTNSVFIDANDIFKSDIESFISSDGLHPNSAGYQAVSKAIADSKKLNLGAFKCTMDF